MHAAVDDQRPHAMAAGGLQQRGQALLECQRRKRTLRIHPYRRPEACVHLGQGLQVHLAGAHRVGAAGEAVDAVGLAGIALPGDDDAGHRTCMGFAQAQAQQYAAEALALILDLFAPHTAEEMWSLLGYAPFVGLATWRQPDPTLLVEESVTAVVQIDGKVRSTLTVPARISSDELETLARTDEKVVRALAGREITRAVVRAPKVVSFTTA